MFGRAIVVGVAVLALAVPASAQQRGTLEFGAFGSNASYDGGLGMSNSWGGGGRMGVFVLPRLSFEFEGNGSSAGRSLGLSDVNVGILSARMTAVPIKKGRVSILLGVGADHTDTYFIESYGVHGLLGLKIALSDAVALRVDGIPSYMANGKYTNFGLHFGMSVYRNPVGLTTTVTKMVAAPPTVLRPDSVSAAETRRLRAVAYSYQALRDSLARPAPVEPPSSLAAAATMRQMVHFQREKWDLSDTAKAILDEKVVVFKANPDMRIIITGYTSEPGTAAYNMALGLKRADAAKNYLVSKGVDPIRVEISTRGEGRLLVEGPGEAANAENRRGQFRILIADPYLEEPKKQ